MGIKKTGQLVVVGDSSFLVCWMGCIGEKVTKYWKFSIVGSVGVVPEVIAWKKGKTRFEWRHEQRSKASKYLQISEISINHCSQSVHTHKHLRSPPTVVEHNILLAEGLVEKVTDTKSAYLHIKNRIPIGGLQSSIFHLQSHILPPAKLHLSSTVHSLVVQGSVFAPLLFLLFRNAKLLTVLPCSMQTTWQ